MLSHLARIIIFSVHVSSSDACYCE